jgi:hypothetical protein
MSVIKRLSAVRHEIAKSHTFQLLLIKTMRQMPAHTSLSLCEAPLRVFTTRTAVCLGAPSATEAVA